jgi:4-amino-4-deoxy-L-arabinose transferase-like glycosyltransferase
MKHVVSDIEHLKLIQLMVGVLNCVLIFSVGKKIFSRAVAFMGALIYATYGNIIILETTLEPLVFVILFNLLSVFFLVQSSERSTIRYFHVAAAGLFAGLSVVTKPNYLLFIPVAIILLLLIQRNSHTLQKRIICSILFLGMASAAILPVTYRNYTRFHDKVLVTADFGKVLFQGNGKNANGLYRANLAYLINDRAFFAEIAKSFHYENTSEFSMPVLEAKDIFPNEKDAKEPDALHRVYRNTAEKIVGRELSPSEASKFWAKVAVRSVLTWPRESLDLQMRKLVFFFHDFETHMIGPSHWEYKKSLSYPFLRYGAISALGLLGMILGFKNFKNYFLAYCVLSIYLFSGLLLCVTSRYRAPAVPFVCLFAGYALYTIYKFYAIRKIRMLVVCLVCLALFAAGTHLPYREDIAYYDQGFLTHYMNSFPPPYEKRW